MFLARPLGRCTYAWYQCKIILIQMEAWMGVCPIL